MRRRFAVTPAKLAHALDIPVNRIRALISEGYLCTIPGKFGDRIIRSKPLHDLPPRIVDRISIMLWLLGLDDGTTIPIFNKTVEIEIMRIAKLKEPWRTEQALRMLLRYRDAETIVKAVSKARSGDVAAAEIKRLGDKYRRRLLTLSGLARAKEHARRH